MDSSAIILGFTGSIGSGCTFISGKLPDISAKYKYKYFKLSNIIREYLTSKEIAEKFTINVLQDTGNELRKQFGNEYIVKTLISKISEDAAYKDCNEIIIDGIKNAEEVNYLKAFPYFFLFSIQADREVRSHRCLNGNIVSTSTEFLEADKRDEIEEQEYGQQVKECDYLSDIIILNNEIVPLFPESKREEFVRRIYNKYIVPVEILREGKKSPDIKLSIDEFAMTTAYAISKMSSCEKRKVGAVIIDIQKPDRDSGTDKYKKINEIPYIVSTGYNEVPIGSYMCVYDPEYQKCYRDYQQEQFAPKIKYCPNCGKEIIIKIECKKCGEQYDKFIKVCQCHEEIETAIICTCGKNIFKEFLPGGKETPGKLLDLCRSLHAEENALLNIMKIGTKYNNNLILYTTTQPCNLCANKIVAAGIKQVVFGEPYPMIQSETILRRGGVVVKRFQGVKSSAYFRLYQ